MLCSLDGRSHASVLISSDQFRCRKGIRSIMVSFYIRAQQQTLVYTCFIITYLIFPWIPSHVSIPRNNKVDSLACATLTQVCPRLSSVPASDCPPAFRSFLYHHWQTLWSSLSNNKLWSIKPSIFPWTQPSHCNRCGETDLALLYIGHTHFAHSYFMSRSPQPSCPSCNVTSSLHHLLLVCLTYAHARLTTFPYHSSLTPYIADILNPPGFL